MSDQKHRRYEGAPGPKCCDCGSDVRYLELVRSTPKGLLHKSCEADAGYYQRMAQDAAPVNANYPRCTVCGDGAEAGHELCATCEKKRDEPKPLSARTDNWRASMRYPKSRYR